VLLALLRLLEDHLRLAGVFCAPGTAYTPHRLTPCTLFTSSRQLYPSLTCRDLRAEPMCCPTSACQDPVCLESGHGRSSSAGDVLAFPGSYSLSQSVHRLGYDPTTKRYVGVDKVRDTRGLALRFEGVSVNRYHRIGPPRDAKSGPSSLGPAVPSHPPAVKSPFAHVA